ncbi:hypothetical protein HB939_06715 [Listeria welshimeri]|nr:hypothetical protein [Listeria welshimeri]
MQIFPAIDLKNGQCVRLFQGDFSKKMIVNEDPIAQAKAFATGGATYLHIVDLDGALEGRPVNLEIIQKMVIYTALSSILKKADKSVLKF